MILLDFNYPEDVLIKVEHRTNERDGWRISHCKVINPTHFIGAATYEQTISGLLPHAIKDTLPKLDEGYYLVGNVTAVFGLWNTDLDIQYAYCDIKSITEKDFYV